MLKQKTFRGYTVKRLKTWACEQRRRYRRGWLSKSQVQRLEKIPGWNWEKQFRTPEQWVPIAEQLAAQQADGVLPRRGRLQKMGHSRLVELLKRQPALFAHIRQHSALVRTPEQWVPIAEQLAAQQADGVLPSRQQIQRMCRAPRGMKRTEVQKQFGGLARALQQYPELFKHIKQSSFRFRAIRRTPEQWVPIAEKIVAKEKDGLLPNGRELDRMGFCGLITAVRQRPRLFKHIKRRITNRTSEQWVPIAVALAAKSEGGILPTRHELVTMGMSGLCNALHKHPALFAHIKTPGSFFRTPEQWLAIAEELVAKDKGGKIPSCKELRRIGLRGLIDAMDNHPVLFKHLTQRLFTRAGKEITA